MLAIDSLDSVKFIDGEVYGESEVKGFQSLEKLELISMPNLEGWSLSVEAAVAAATTTQQLLLSCLKELFLAKCPKLKGPLPLSSSLVRLDMIKCNETVFGYVRDLPCLSTLHISEFDELVHFSEGALQNLTSLQLLSIFQCKKLKALTVEVESLATLSGLQICDCAGLASLGELEGIISSLKTLCIDICPILKRSPKFDKTCLEVLYINDCPELEFSTEDFEEDIVVLETLTLRNVPKMKGGFPEGLKHASMLQTLDIRGCCSKEENEMDLPDWIGSLTSLQHLYIEGCKNRKVLPEGLQNPTALKLLCIFGCNEELERRYKKKKGKYWFNIIAHVPRVIIKSKSNSSW